MSSSAAVAGADEAATTLPISSATQIQRICLGTNMLEMRNTRDIVLSVTPFDLLTRGVDFRNAIVVSDQCVAVGESLSAHRIHERHATGPNLLGCRIHF